MLPSSYDFSAAETAACQRLIVLAFDEDSGVQAPGQGDVTSQAVIPAELPGRAVFIARVRGVLSGMTAAKLVLQAVDPNLHFEKLKEDGHEVRPSDQLGVVSGPMRGILAAERTALNFLQRLSGIASLTRQYVEAVAGLKTQILDTRKTTPGWRLLEKYAVRCGGGHNHRIGLFDGVLIKDNHLAALPIADRRGQIEEAIRRARAHARDLTIEVEVDTLEQLDCALACHPHIVLLDNMSLEQLREGVRRRNKNAPQVLLEASGGVNLATVRAIAETGVDRISVGALTHSAPALDIALDYAI